MNGMLLFVVPFIFLALYVTVLIAILVRLKSQYLNLTPPRLPQMKTTSFYCNWTQLGYFIKVIDKTSDALELSGKNYR